MPGSSQTSGSSRKIIVYALIGILAVAAVSVSVFARPPAPSIPQSNGQNSEQEFREVWCGPNASAKSTSYITEVVLPNECEMPVGIAVDDSQVWYLSTKQGSLGSYNLSEKKFKEYQIPQWPSRDQTFAKLPQMSWTVKIDETGNVWFTDQFDAIWRFNKVSESFEMFKVPASYPSALDFDSNGNVYFIGIDSKSLFFGDVSKMKSGTSDGITEIPLPLDGFAEVDLKLVTTGLLVVDNERKAVWVSLLAFQQKGQIFRYDIDTGKIDRVIDLPIDLSSPVGAAIDNSGNLWVADHGTSIFFKYDRTTEKITRFVTSIASPKIYGGTTPPNAYTLPYWLATGKDNKLWFNEHVGNKIARFDPDNLILTEYWIPSQNRNLLSCPPDSATCGLANALQFGISPDSDIWFSEWTENKIAELDSKKQVPISISTTDEITVARGRSAEIKVIVNASENFDGKMMSATTFMPNGMLGNSTGIFSEELISVAGEARQVSYIFTPSDTLLPGQYIMMIGTGNEDVSVLKAVKVNII